MAFLLPSSLSGWMWLAGRLAILVALAWLGLAWWLRMPGSSHSGPLPALTARQQALALRLEGHVLHLAGTIGPRHLFGREQALAAAASYLTGQLEEMGLAPDRQTYQVNGLEAVNIEVVIPGTAPGPAQLVVGAHYDSVPGSPGADDNGSGTALLLELARSLAKGPLEATTRLVFFTNEEPPFFQTGHMGSLVYARRARQAGLDLHPVIVLESLGLYDTRPGSQHYPPPFSLFYPDTADFVAIVGNIASRDLVRQCTGLFRRRANFPAEGAALPGWVTGVGWSDHWAFWQEGYQAVMVTDTALFRSRGYHTPADTPDTLDYPRMARVMTGLEAMLRALPKSSPPPSPKPTPPFPATS